MTVYYLCEHRIIYGCNVQKCSFLIWILLCGCRLTLFSSSHHRFALCFAIYFALLYPFSAFVQRIQKNVSCIASKKKLETAIDNNNKSNAKLHYIYSNEKKKEKISLHGWIILSCIESISFFGLVSVVCWCLRGERRKWKSDEMANAMEFKAALNVFVCVFGFV